MKKVLKQTAGVDVALDELVVTFGQLYEDFSIELIGIRFLKIPIQVYCHWLIG